MFSFFKKKPALCPVDQETHEWMGQAFSWLWDEFGNETVLGKDILLPDFEHFPIVYNGEEQAAFDSLDIVARQMEVDPHEIQLDFYLEGISEVGAGGIGGSKFFVNSEKDAKKSSGLYHGKQEDGKYHISLEKKNLTDPVFLVATLAHEIAHIKLLGEEWLNKNNESLTDLTTIIFGLGIFNANASFRFSTGFDQWGYRKIGYLTQIEWGYALALYSFLMRNEPDPKWINLLSETVRGNFRRGVLYMKGLQ